MSLKRNSCNCSNYSEQINEILETFDFESVLKMMEWDDWQLYIDGTLQLPTLDYLKNLAKQLLVKASEEVCSRVATGPFRVEKRFGALELLCVYESSSV